MNIQYKTVRYALSALVILFAGIATVGAQAPAADQQATITKKALAFVEAFQKADASALAAFWTSEGDYTDLNGRVLKGRKAIAQDFTEFFAANKGMALRIDVQSIRFPTPDTAIEDGVTSVLPPDGGIPERTRYTNLLVKKDGDWLLESVRESAYTPQTNYDQLKGLEWIIGEWVEDTKENHVRRVVFDWTPDGNYIVGTRAVDVKGLPLESGSERIGWDPAAKLIRSWNFDSDGTFGHGTWKSEGTKWIISSSSVLASGALAKTTTTITPVDANTIALQTRFQVAGKKEPKEMPVVKMKRAK